MPTLLWTLLAISAFGILGCWARFYLTGVLQTALGRRLPYATLTINVTGSLLMGFLAVLLTQRLNLPGPLRIGILTGFLGGYTTFSTFAMEALLLAEDEGIWRSGLYVSLSTILGIGGALLGTVLALAI